MTVDLLSVRLKEANRELTNLKTAHKRGLGGLKVFEFPLSISGYNDYVYTLTVTLTFDQSFTAYPLVTCVPQCDPDTYLSKADLVSMNYTNNGYSAVYNFDWFALTTIDPYNLVFYSSAPIVDWTYTFVRSS